MNDRLIKSDGSMKKLLISILSLGLCVLMLAGCGAAGKTEKVTNRYQAYALNGYDRAGFEVKTSYAFVDKGLAFVSYHYNDLFGSPQDISIIEIDPRKYRFSVLDHKSLKRTSEAAAEAGAVAAINGTFYNMKQGGSVCYLQIDGAVSDTTKGSNMQLRANGAVVIRNGKLSVEPWNQEKEQTFRSKYLPSSQSHNSQSARSHNSQSAASATKSAAGDRVSVMATMPLLVQDGHPVEILLNKGFSDKRHPRSVIFEKDGRVCLMVIDGRSKGNASGMTLDEVQTYILSIDGGKGCTSAVNLDGGGSSTLWISTSAFSSQPGTLSFDSSSPTQFSDTGVLNHPSDNGKFDHKGERSVANSIIVLRK